MNETHKIVGLTEADPRFVDFAALAPALPVEGLAAAAQRFERYGRRRHLLLLEGDRAVGRLTAAVNPRVAADPRGAVGYLGDPVLPGDAEAAGKLLTAGLEWLRAEGCVVVRAPVRFHTWYAYRFVTEGFDHPPVPGEPWNPEHVPRHFLTAGFEPRVRYESRVTEDLLRHVEDNRRELERLEASPLVVRPFDPSRAEWEMQRLHAVTHAAFSRNFSFSAIDLDEFALVHAPFMARLRPEFLLLCEDPRIPEDRPERLAAFMLWFPAPSEPGTAVLKTLGVHPAHQGDGLGAALTAVTHRTAHELGFRRAVHALMRSGRPPATTSARSLGVWRRYALVEREL